MLTAAVAAHGRSVCAAAPFRTEHVKGSLETRETLNHWKCLINEVRNYNN